MKINEPLGIFKHHKKNKDLKPPYYYLQGCHDWQGPQSLDFGFQYVPIGNNQSKNWGRILGLAWLKFAVA